MADDYDTPWKEVVTCHFPEFMAFYFPAAHAAIDWSRPHDFLDQEMAALSRDAELGKQDYAPRIEALLADANPFALVTAAHLLTQQTQRNPYLRRRSKWRLTKLLYQRQWNRQRIIDLYRVIDWLMRLPESLEIHFRRGVMELERRGVMPYITSIERHGMKVGREEGLKEGRQEGRAELLLALLVKRFGPLEAAVVQRVARAAETQLSAWALNFVDARSLEEVFRD